MKRKKLWYVIADGGRARFVERDANGAFRTIASFVASELHTRAHDLGLDHPARVKESANAARHSIAPRRDLHEAAKEDFIRTVADALAAEHGQGQFNQLVLVAPARVLTELKDQLGRPIAESVVSDLQKDLTKISDHDLATHLSPPR